MPSLVYGFMDPEEKENHFLDHNREFEPEFISADEYEAAAIAFLAKSLSATIYQCTRNNGDVIRFDQSTDEFAICNRKGDLKTYYKPDIYWHRQETNLAYFKGAMRKMMTYLCPVCGYKHLSHPPQDDTICPCCGTHFGYHDYATSSAELRARWISKGALWFSHARQQPLGWDPWLQLWESGLGFQVQNASSEDMDTKNDSHVVNVIENVVVSRTATST